MRHRDTRAPAQEVGWTRPTGTRLTGVEELRAAGVSVNGLA